MGAAQTVAVKARRTRNRLHRSRSQPNLDKAESMKPDEFAKWARGSAEPLRVDDISIATPEGVFEGSGTLRTENERFVLKVTLNDNSARLPEVRGTYTCEQFWKISGRIEDKLPFSAEDISGHRSSHRGHYVVEQVTFKLDHLSLVTERTREADHATAAAVLEMPSTEDAHPPTFWGYAYLEGHKPIWQNASTGTKITNDFLGESGGTAGDTFMGDFEHFEFALIRIGDDCEAYLRTRVGSPITEEQFRRTFAAFKTAIAFVHGREAWPQHLRITHGLLTIEETVHPRRELASTPFRLLNNRACANGADFALALVSATKFFLQSDAISDLVKRTLYLCRQSSLRVTPLDVGTLSMCAVFEGLVTGLHRCLASPDASDDAHAFNNAKAELLALARQRETEGAPGFSRLVGLLGGAKPYRTKDAFQWLTSHFGLPWEPQMREAFAAWNSERHSLAHGSEPAESSCDRMTCQSRIAGSINLIVARLMGYAGLALFSALEDRFVRLSERAV
jgi:hypothetical protein